MLAARTRRRAAPRRWPRYRLRRGRRTLMLDGLDATVAAAFERALRRLRAAGARIEEIDAAAARATCARIKATGGFSAAES